MEDVAAQLQQQPRSVLDRLASLARGRAEREQDTARRDFLLTLDKGLGLFAG